MESFGVKVVDIEDLCNKSCGGQLKHGCSRCPNFSTCSSKPAEVVEEAPENSNDEISIQITRQKLGDLVEEVVENYSEEISIQIRQKFSDLVEKTVEKVLETYSEEISIQITRQKFADLVEKTVEEVLETYSKEVSIQINRQKLADLVEKTVEEFLKTYSKEVSIKIDQHVPQKRILEMNDTSGRTNALNNTDGKSLSFSSLFSSRSTGAGLKDLSMYGDSSIEPTISLWVILPGTADAGDADADAGDADADAGDTTGSPADAVNVLREFINLFAQRRTFMGDISQYDQTPGRRDDLTNDFASRVRDHLVNGCPGRKTSESN